MPRFTIFLVCVDHFSRFVVLAPVETKTAPAIAHALVTHLFCPYTTPRVLLSDNGTEFRNALLIEICSKYNIKQTFTVAYHPSSNGLVERANRKILEALRHVVTSLHNDWEDWIPQVAACINGSVCESTVKTPHYILYGVDKRLPYDLLAGPAKPVYNVEDYTSQHLKVFTDIHRKVREKTPSIPSRNDTATVQACDTSHLKSGRHCNGSSASEAIQIVPPSSWVRA